MFKLRKGQSLTEFAVFSSLSLIALGALVRMGLNMNYQQEINMRVFRRTMIEAKWHDPNAMGASVTAIKDKRLYDVGDKAMTGETSPIFSSASVVWSGDLMADRTYNENDIPTATFEINGVTRKYKIGAYIEGQWPTTPYRYKKVGNPSKAVPEFFGDDEKKTRWICDGQGQFLPNGKERHWYWECVSTADSAHITEGASLEVTGDVYEETVAEVKEEGGDPDDWEDDKDSQFIVVKVIDYTKGEINLVDDSLYQGLTGSRGKETDSVATIITKDHPGLGFKTTISNEVSDTVKYEIKTNSGKEWIETTPPAQSTSETWSN